MTALVAHGTPARYLTFPSLGALGLSHAVTTRHCPGVTSPASRGGPFQPAAADVLREVGLDVARVAYARQVHGADHRRVAAPGPAGVADILVTTEPAQPLAIFTADCVPLTLYDPDAGVLGVAHAGWRGTAAGCARNTVLALVDLGAHLASLHATIGPSVGPCCYEVDAPVTQAFAAAYPESFSRWFTPARPEHWMLDLWTANEDALLRAGISAARIDNPRACTACDPGLFYSYRKGHHGRLVSIAALP